MSLAVRDALLRLAPEGIEPHIVDVFALERPTIFDRITRLYSPVIRHAPRLYGWAFHLTNRPRVYQTITAQARRTLLPKVRRLLLAHQPDVLVSVHPLGNPLVLEARRALGATVPVVAVTTELVTIHRSWVEPGITHYTTATPEAHVAVVRLGAPPDRISCPGLPIQERFGRVPTPPAEIRRGLGLDPERLTLLVMGGGEGTGGLDRLVAAIAGSGVEAQLIVVCGRNRRVRERLARTRLAHPAAVLGFTDRMPELMHAADLIVTKGGPQTLAEALASGRPVVVTQTLPGQEEGNAEFIEARGAGFDGRRLPRALWAIRRLATDPGERQAMAARARALARPEAATEVARTILRLGVGSHTGA